jgi:23S rRNA (adenine-N6)-dimethyltransferase
VDARQRVPRPRARRPSGQHFLRSDLLAAELVAQSGVCADDQVVEVGAGFGRLTIPLARTGARVIAIELDPALAERLQRRFGNDPRVRIVHGDVLDTPFPDGPFRVFGNAPFGIGTAILRRLLDDPDSPLSRVDLILQHEVARKRATLWPSTLLSLGWLPWWRFSLERRIDRGAFSPPPAVDAALLSVRRRDPPLLPAEQRIEFVRFARVAFGSGSQPARRSIGQLLSNHGWLEFARQRGIAPSAAAREVDVFDYVAAFRMREVRSPRRD